MANPVHRALGHPLVDEVDQKAMRSYDTERTVECTGQAHSDVDYRLEQPVQLVVLGYLSCDIEQLGETITCGDGFHLRTIP